MTQRRFDFILEGNPEKRNLVRYIVKLPFTTTVELGSMLLQVIDDTDEKEVRAALLGLAFAVFQREITK